MNSIQFKREFEENVVFVEVGSLSEDTILVDLEEWDSMATVSTMALIDELFNVTVNAQKITACRTLGDLLALVQEKIEGK